METRLATTADALAITEIYNQGIADRSATFETRPRSVDDIRGWFKAAYPIVVVVDDGRVIAFASTSLYRTRECYSGIAEFSVYVLRAKRRRGAGRLAMQALLQEAQRCGFWKLLSRIFVENTASRTLMRNLGFREVGVYRKHGKLDGRWRDVVIVEYLIEANLI
ncbi:MAG TPA: arsinothricin resistance N-acetyltransferase ArsN1 family A [Anaerolineae bacterium]|nr:arsinothricin resistance N-acetyltransferase ArsN1 family A [Anaerolineae bacterium]